MSREPTEFDRAHLAYTERRLLELRAECRDAFQALGQQFGVDDLAPDEVTPELVDKLFTTFVAVIRHRGQPDLADRYQAAFVRQQQRLQECAQLVQQAQTRDLTDAEQARLAALDQDADDAAEQFEQVAAEASAFFASLEDDESRER